MIVCWSIHILFPPQLTVVLVFDTRVDTRFLGCQLKYCGQNTGGGRNGICNDCYKNTLDYLYDLCGFNSHRIVTRRGVLLAVCLSHLFASGSWNCRCLEPVRHRADPSNRRTTAVTEDTRETVFLFQCLSIALQRGNEVAFLATFDAMWYPVVVVVFA